MELRFYEVEGMKRGFTVSDVCGIARCEEVINRSLDYLCFRCKKYFCKDHLINYYDDKDKEVKFECFAGDSSQICENCADELEENKS